MALEDQRPQSIAQDDDIKAVPDLDAAEPPRPEALGADPSRAGPAAEPSALVAALASLASSDDEATALLRAVLSMQSELTAAAAPGAPAPTAPSVDGTAAAAAEQLKQENETLRAELRTERELVMAWRLAFEEAQRSVESLRRRVGELEGTLETFKAQVASAVGFGDRGAPAPQLEAPLGAWPGAAPASALAQPPSHLTLQQLASSIRSLIEQPQPQQLQAPRPYFRPSAAAATVAVAAPPRPPVVVSVPQGMAPRPAAAVLPARPPVLKAPAPQRLRGGSDSRRRFHWSPELHDGFKRAVDQLGGPASATPKAIWQVMQSEELTLDRIKSHLQKYRLKVAGGGTSSDEDDDVDDEGEEAQGMEGEEGEEEDGVQRFLAAQRSRGRRRAGTSDEGGGDGADGAAARQGEADDSMAATLLNLAAGT